MTAVTFLKKADGFSGYSFRGHSGYACEGEDIVCAAISSAAYLTANDLELLGIKTDVTVKDGLFKLAAEGSDTASKLIEGLYRHMLQLQEQYGNYIKVKISEV